MHTLIAQALQRLRNLRDREFLMHFSGTVGLRLISGALLLLAHGTLAAYLGVSGYGAYAVALSTLNVLLLASRLGLDVATVRYVAGYHANGDWPALRGYLLASRGFVLCSSALILAVGAIALFILKIPLDARLRSALIFIAPALPFFALAQINDATLRGYGHVLTGQVALAIAQPMLLLIGTLLGWALWGARHSLAIAGVSLSLSYLGAFLVNQALALQRHPPELRGVSATWRLREWFFATPAMLIVSGFAAYQQQIIVIYLGFAADTRTAGIVAIAMRIAASAQTIVSASVTSAAPAISRANAMGDTDSLSRVTATAAELSVIAALPVLIILALGGESILRMAGTDYAAGYVPLLIFLSGMTVQSIFAPAVIFTGVTGHHNVVSAIFVITLLVCVGVPVSLGLAVTPALASMEAALSTASSFFMIALIAYSRTGIRCWPRSIPLLS